MQLTSRDSQMVASTTRRGLAAATCALLGSVGSTAGAAEVESAVLLYSEPDRVTGVETVIQANQELASGHKLFLKLVWDALTGASANGATPSRQLQTFTRPSGRGAFQTAPGQTPLDDTFRDTRVAAQGSWTRPWGASTSTTLGANVSSEIDYLSLGISGNVSREMFLQNTVVSAGFAVSRDRINPQGGTPVPFSSMLAATGEGEDDDRALPLRTGEDDDPSRMGGSNNKTVLDLLLGVSQVLDRATVAQINYSASRVSGYQTDPYKILSVLQPSGSEFAGEPTDYVYERRPEARMKHSLFGGLKRRLGADVADVSYRYFWDDWGVRSHTAELRYSRRIGRTWDLEPHLRRYHQREADHYRRFLVAAEPVPSFASADYRLGSFDATTYGLQLAHDFGGGARFTVSGEYYLQHGDSSPPEAYGALQGLDLFPDVDAVMFRVGYSRRLGR